LALLQWWWSAARRSEAGKISTGAAAGSSDEPVFDVREGELEKWKNPSRRATLAPKECLHSNESTRLFNHCVYVPFYFIVFGSTVQISLSPTPD
jgi:hypothetical protein